MPDPTITLEDGTGKTNSNAYIDVADTEVRIEKQKEFSAWKNLPPNDQVLAIIAAAQYLDIHFRFYGSPFPPIGSRSISCAFKDLIRTLRNSSSIVSYVGAPATVS